MSGFSAFLLPLIILAIFYFLVIVPQRRRQQEVQAMVESLKIGDTVVTGGGVVGKILETRERTLIIRSGDKSNLEITRAAVVEKVTES